MYLLFIVFCTIFLSTMLFYNTYINTYYQKRSIITYVFSMCKYIYIVILNRSHGYECLDIPERFIFRLKHFPFTIYHFYRFCLAFYRFSVCTCICVLFSFHFYRFYRFYRFCLAFRRFRLPFLRSVCVCSSFHFRSVCISFSLEMYN